MQCLAIKSCHWGFFKETNLSSSFIMNQNISLWVIPKLYILKNNILLTIVLKSTVVFPFTPK